MLNTLLKYGPLVLAIIAFLTAAWQICKRITVPVAHIEFDSMVIQRFTGHIRTTEKISLKSAKPMPLYRGNNDFYVTVQNRKVKYHSRYVLDTITPIIRDAEGIQFFRIQLRTVGGKVTTFTQTSLAEPNVTLHWRTKGE